MRHESSITSLSWIPSEAVEGSSRVAFETGLVQYDEPPPERLTDLEALRLAGRFRFANVLDAWIEVDGKGAIRGWGHEGGGLMGATTVKLGPLTRTFEAVELPELRRPPKKHADGVTFTQTVGGRTGVPAPRRVRRRPFVQWQAPLAWTTLSLTIHADGRAEGLLEGCSRFPRHWVYDARGELSQKSGLSDFSGWYRKSFGRHTPWGDQDSKALVTAVESALERRLSAQVMGGGEKPKVRRVKAGTRVIEQGDSGSEVFLILDGVLRVEHDGEPLAEYGPGALLGERAHLEGGTRSSSLVAVTPCRLASIGAEQLEDEALHELSEGHRRETSRRRTVARG